MPEKVEDYIYYYPEKEIKEALEKGYNESSFSAGWQGGYDKARQLYGAERVRQSMEEALTSPVPEIGSPMILRPGEVAVISEPPPGTRSIGTAAGVSIIQALKESGWDLEKILLCWIGLVASLILLGLGMKMIFGPELLAQGVAGFWGWFVQPG